MKQEIEHYQATTRAQWRQWLSDNHQTAKGVWLVSYKKSTGLPFVTYDEAVEEALCFGWIDSKPNKIDEQRSELYFAPRQLKSNWSKLNKDRVERLLAQDLIRPAGLEKIEIAKQTGTWDALNEVENTIIPSDLQAALENNPPALANFEAFPRSARRGILEWILNAKQAATRQNRIDETTRLAAQNIRANQYVKK